MQLKGKHILVGISGGIAAYKIPLLIRLLRKAGAEVRVVCTENALQFVTPVTLETLSNNKVYTDVFAPHNEHETEHISLPDWADLMVVAPCTANCIGKFANGIADNALTTTFLAMLKPVLIVPAMNQNMLLHPATQANLQRLSDFPHCTVMATQEGELACGVTGQGRMPEVDEIFGKIVEVLENQKNISKTDSIFSNENAVCSSLMKGKKVLLTAGPTVERIDPVRYISNFSTGKMGYALSAVCQRLGAEVTVVSGPVEKSVIEHSKVDLDNLKIVSVESAEQMYNAATQLFADADITILCAAVADYTPAETSLTKLKRHDAEYSLELKATKDIAARLGKQKKENQLLIGFALETDNEISNAQKKLESKNLDMIVLNSLADNGAGFGTDTNKITLLFKDGKRQEFELKSKESVACDIVNAILTCIR